jgi:hypothetical protein
MSRDAAVTVLAERLDEALESQRRLLALVVEQRPAIAGGHHLEVDAIAGRIELEVRRLSAIEQGRDAAAQALADELGLAATRWSVLREGLTPGERTVIAPRIQAIEAIVRDLELANAVNGQLVRQELDLVDMSVRSLATIDRNPAHRAYTAGGTPAAAPASGPLMLNTAA